MAVAEGASIAAAASVGALVGGPPGAATAATGTYAGWEVYHSKQDTAEANERTEDAQADAAAERAATIALLTGDPEAAGDILDAARRSKAGQAMAGALFWKTVWAIVKGLCVLGALVLILVTVLSRRGKKWRGTLERSVADVHGSLKGLQGNGYGTPGTPKVDPGPSAG